MTTGHRPDNTGQVCAAVTPGWSQTCLQALALGQLGLLELCPQCTETVILALRLRLAQRARSPVAGEPHQQLVTGVDTPAGERQMSPATGGRLTLLRQPPAPARQPAGDRLDAELLARAYSLIAASEATPGRRIGRLALADALGTTPYWARQALAHYDTHASSPAAGDTSTEVTSA